jgi:hypothetical protein
LFSSLSLFPQIDKQDRLGLIQDILGQHSSTRSNTKGTIAMINPQMHSFLTLASRSPQTITFATHNEAMKYRLRLYNYKKKFPFPLTILVRDNQVTAGPEGFDLVATFSPETIKAMEKLEEENRKEFDEMFSEKASKPIESAIDSYLKKKS